MAKERPTRKQKITIWRKVFSKMCEWIKVELPNVVQHMPAMVKAKEEYEVRQKAIQEVISAKEEKKSSDKK